MRKYKLNIEKRNFCVFKVEALGHKIFNKSLLPLEKKTDAINKLYHPMNIKRLCSFLGMAYYYRNFIENDTSLSFLLCKFLKKNSMFEWTNNHIASFNLLREALINTPILCYPRFDKPFLIRSNASYQGIGGILLQLYDDKIEYPVFYISRTLHKSEYNYLITELEGTAAYYYITKFKSYILGNSFQTI